MKYYVELKPKAIKDLKGLPKTEGKRIIEKLNLLEDDLQGNVKRLTNYTPEYRLRVGDWRVLFEVDDNKIIVYRIRHRKEAYK
ncbi:MAG: type II toxin-antitoxin system RelE family toxin [bacterium]